MMSEFRGRGVQNHLKNSDVINGCPLTVCRLLLLTVYVRDFRITDNVYFAYVENSDRAEVEKSYQQFELTNL